MELNYRGETVKLYEAEGKWQWSDASSVNLNEVKKSIDAFKKEVFNEMGVIWINPEGGKYELATITSKNGGDSWIRTFEGKRKQVKAYRLYADTPENRTAITLINEAHDRIQELKVSSGNAERSMKTFHDYIEETKQDA